MPDNMWPDFSAQAHNTASPKRVIEQAGAGLAKQTNDLVKFWSQNTAVKDDKIEILFSLYVPSLPYFYPFMRVKYGVSSPYPVELTADKLNPATCSDEASLLVTLHTIFNAPSTVTTVSTLMSTAS